MVTCSSNESIDSSLVDQLTEMVDTDNNWARLYRRLGDAICSLTETPLHVRLFRDRQTDSRIYNLPSVDEIAGLIIGDFDSSDVGRDVIVKKIGGDLQRIDETHVAFIPLQYPLLFPFGEDGYHENIAVSSYYATKSKSKKVTISLREFIAFRLHEHECDKGVVLYGKRLFQQFVVDCYSMIEAHRLLYIRRNQNDIRSGFLDGLEEAISHGDVDGASVGVRIVLPSSFTGGRRYMFNNAQDAMAICKTFGYPDLFITFTCNPKWPEIIRHVGNRELTISDRPDVACRVFRMKLDAMMNDFRKGLFFGNVVAGELR